ncbi:MAG: hypothetical protein QOJ02_880 [Acidobacteriota bacterium]|nr:hypothetical protein [Acidobacteriota bacterium]
MLRLKFDQHINITRRTEIIANNRAEKGQLADVMSATEVFDLFSSNFEVLLLHPFCCFDPILKSDVS